MTDSGAESLAEYLKILEMKPEESAVHCRIAHLLRGACGKISQEAIVEAARSLGKTSEQTPQRPIVWNTLALALNASVGLPAETRQLQALEAAVHGCDLAEASGTFLAELRRTLREVFQGCNQGKACRISLLSHLPPYAAIEDLVAGLDGEVEVSRCSEVAFQSWNKNGDPVSSKRARYLAALLLEREKRSEEALEILRGLAAEDDSRPEPSISMARILRSHGNPAMAAQLLRSMLEKGPSQPRSLLDLWLEIQLDDLKLAPKQILADLVRAPEGREPGAYASDVVWLLERLSENKGVRINCGGPEITSPDGSVWGRDRFFLGGETLQSEDIHVAVTNATGAEALYQHLRGFSFSEDESLWGYRIPFPKGKYHVRLHFAEIDMNVRGFRRFDVLILERSVLSDFDAIENAGFRKAVVKEFDIELNGGPLSIRFAFRRGHPSVSAIEVELVQ